MKLCDALSRNDQDPQHQALIRRAQIFDLDNLVPLLGDWERERLHPIPKRPPFDLVFAQWKETRILVGNGRESDRVPSSEGVLIQKIAEQELGSDMYAWNKQRGWDEWYRVSWFAQIRGQLVCGPAPHLMALKENSTIAQSYTVSARRDSFKSGQSHGYIILTVPRDDISDNNVTSPGKGSIAFLSFALLHCKNVTTELHRPDAALQRATIRRGHAPLMNWHTLTLHVPVTTSPSLNGTSAVHQDARLHMVRGHFKNLQHERFTNKGWHWWPAHLRGNPEFGIVDKDYVLRPSAR